MKIALIGYGKMGKAIEKIAINRGHEITTKITSQNTEQINSNEFKQANVAIEFSNPESALENILHCLNNKIPVVVGTTGWLEKIEDIRLSSLNNNTPVFYASNFSIGMNITFALNEKLAKWMNELGEYDVNIEETHHIHKLDSPSGTAISLAEGIIKNLDRKDKWGLNDTNESNNLKLASLREGEVPGTHIIEYKSNIDRIELKHEAFNRSGFALGAVKVAEWIPEKKGVLNMKDYLNY